ncbi:MAG: TonB-dependent receptor [Acidobacteria bacterium]|nr:TonB-dependent receptor [Acidobacteriota bacterium]
MQSTRLPFHLSASKFCCIVSLFFGFLLAAGLPALAQVTATLQGRVTDDQNLAVAGAALRVTNPELAVDRAAVTGAEGEFRVPGLPAGTYRIEVSKAGFDTKVLQGLELTVNQVAAITVKLSVASVKSVVSVEGEAPLLETTISSTGKTIMPSDIQSMPINGRNYLDLMQLVPGVTVNRQVDQGSDASVPVLGQRGNNAQFLIDGMPNSDSVSGGAAAQFNQESILEFQVLTAGYKAEFGHGSGGVINVLSKSGTNVWHGAASVFARNSVFDSSDIPSRPDVPFLNRWDPSVQFGGPIAKDKVFLFGSVERIMESRSLNFQFDPSTPDILRELEAPYNKHTLTHETRVRGKLDEQIGNHRLGQQINLTNSHINSFLPLSAALSLPSTRYNESGRHLMLGFTDTATLGDQADPYLLNYYVQFREEPSLMSPTYPEAGGANTLDNLFSSLDTNELFGDLGQVSYGAGFTPLHFHQKYWSLGANVGRAYGNHTVKIGWEFQKMLVDGAESTNNFNQLFSLQDDLGTYGPINSGVYYLNVQGGQTPQESHIGLRNNYNALYLQDDWKLTRKLTINAGLRWDYDTRFPNKTNVSPRLGMAWQVLPKTVVRASWGRFYDHFRLGLARDIPDFGGANVHRSRYMAFPRLFYGNPSNITRYFTTLGRDVPCVSSNQTDAQIVSGGTLCDSPSLPLFGIDHLNSIGSSVIPAGAVVNSGNVQQLSGLTPDQFLQAADAAVGKPDGYFTWDPFDHLSVHNAFSAYDVPISVDPGFKTPYTDTFHFGIQQQLTDSMVINADYYHSNIADIPGVRNTNLAFEARIPAYAGELVPGTGSQLINSYGPWYSGFYDGLTLQVTKRMTRHFQVEASYTYAKEWDNMLNSNFVTDFQSGQGAAYTSLGGPSDSYRGIVPVVTDPDTLQTNANGPFVTSTGNPVPKAGTNYNGANVDYGPSDLSVPHIFMVHGIVQLPKGFEISSIFRAQSGFAFTRGSSNPPDVDGDGFYGGRDIDYVRNSFRAPSFVNLDARLAKHFSITERIKAHAYFEVFNLFNNANPAAINGLPPSGPDAPAFGYVQQRLPGREGQVGVRFEF